METRVGEVTYKLKLLDGAQVHPVFHVSQLKKSVGLNIPVSSRLPTVDQDGILHPKPVQVLDIRMRLVNNHPMTMLLVRWQEHRQCYVKKFSQTQDYLSTPCGEGVLKGRVMLQRRPSCDNDGQGITTEQGWLGFGDGKGGLGG